MEARPGRGGYVGMRAPALGSRQGTQSTNLTARQAVLGLDPMSASSLQHDLTFRHSVSSSVKQSHRDSTSLSRGL